MRQPKLCRPRRSTGSEIEEWAFGLFERNLVAANHVVTSIRRPDRLNRVTRDVDYLINVDGREIAVEITQLTQAREWWNLLDRLQDHVRAEVLREGTDDLGWLMLWINLLRTATYREVETVGAQIGRAILRVPRDLASDRWQRLEALPEPAAGIAEVEIRWTPAAATRISFISGHEGAEPWIEPRALAFVDHLIDSKIMQTANYTEVWILVVDNEVIIDLDNLAAAFAQLRDRVPANWTRLLFIPATDRSDIQTLELRSAKDRGAQPTSDGRGQLVE
jgi:hypothetical protein